MHMLHVVLQFGGARGSEKRAKSGGLLSEPFMAVGAEEKKIETPIGQISQSNKNNRNISL